MIIAAVVFAVVFIALVFMLKFFVALVIAIVAGGAVWWLTNLKSVKNIDKKFNNSQKIARIRQTLSQQMSKLPKQEDMFYKCEEMNRMLGLIAEQPVAEDKDKYVTQILDTQYASALTVVARYLTVIKAAGITRSERMSQVASDCLKAMDLIIESSKSSIDYLFTDDLDNLQDVIAKFQAMVEVAQFR